MKILVAGAGGMLGRRLSVLPGCHGADRAALDITDRSAVADAVTGYDAVINAAAWTDVDGAETREAEATALNGDGPANLAAACAASGAVLLHVSTDYVFAGDGTAPYPEDAPTAPINAYGRSKLAGELVVRRLLPDRGYVVRTAWLYDRDGRNFLTTMLRLAGAQETLDVVDDQRGQPTGAPFLAAQLVQLAQAAVAGHAPAGIYHGTAAGETTWFGFAREIFAQAGLDPERVRPTTTDRFPRPAPRPAYSVLGHRRWAAAGLNPQPDWRDELRDVLTGGPVA
ncbi:dTDP-4-dehydrorhamnose reductase [Hamadaea sp. NPDC051192]|uniref:dTDP-4-dehydrorhamnose reductase n=1 Tax=Hamadaea sp. NPDC051192 TaxID=3154940 RepID=UPI003421EA32